MKQNPTKKRPRCEWIYVQLGRNIRRLRLDRSLTQLALGDKIGVVKGHVSNIERGTSRISVHHLHGIANALGVELGMLVSLRCPAA